MFDKRYCKRIKKERLRSGLNQRQLGDILGVTRAYISLMENGDKLPSRTQILAFSSVFRCPVTDLDPDFEITLSLGKRFF